MTTKVPAPRSPAFKEIKDVSKLLPVARMVVKRPPISMMAGLGLKPGDRVLIVSDSTFDPLVAEAISTAIREAGNPLDIIELEGFPKRTDAVEILDGMFSNNWYPDWVWEAAKSYDLMLAGAFMKLPHTPNLPLTKRTRTQNMEWTRYTFSQNYEGFPLEVRDALDAKTWSMMANAANLKITDPEGTDLEFTYSREDWDRFTARNLKRGGKPYLPGHLQIPAPCQRIEGQLATSSITFGGPVPRTTMTISKGQAVKVKGGGKFGRTLAESFAKHSAVLMPRYPGSGVNWISTLALCTHPKSMRSPDADGLAGSGRVHSWTSGHWRSGWIHLSIGEGIVSDKYKVIRHVDLCFPTVIADGRTVVEMGHLLALDDPKIRKLAAKYGDPDRLLTEAWIPAVSGVNAP
jgi:hypothetical protein